MNNELLTQYDFKSAKEIREHSDSVRPSIIQQRDSEEWEHIKYQIQEAADCGALMCYVSPVGEKNLNTLKAFGFEVLEQNSQTYVNGGLVGIQPEHRWIIKW